MKNQFKQIACLLLVHLMSMVTSHAVVLELEGIITVIHDAGSEESKNIVRGSLQKVPNVGKSPNALLANINASRIESEGITYSFPAEYIIELSDESGELVRYRIDFQQPIIRLDDPDFTAEEPSIDLNTYVTIIENQTVRYVSEVNAPQKINHRFHHDLEGREERVETRLPEYWIREFGGLIQFLSNTPQPSKSSSNSHIFKYDNFTLYLFESEKRLESFKGEINNPESHSKFEWIDYDGMKIPSLYLENKEGDMYKTTLKFIRVVDELEATTYFKIQ